ncbi:M48 family metallopeptidase [Methylobacter tundripaludum]|uniref:Peptidase M48 Ste24p n=1 Tax=Methylobacter tundripaludum (strain ATCC BAA-1195 / DSM 17260 / SV96) TaxID=697282 RepID=G3IUH7_METTV|nr:M48 family metallopeptidase [Methylobacter tundripaludum]EGW21587.1 peptidase M48 Ste24p [Methylobacter tundripaludum SV96]
MNFFQSQDDARRKTRSLILMFMLAVIAIVAAVNLVITALIINVGDDAEAATLPDFNWIMNNLPLVASISLVTIGFISLSSLYKIASLSSGGGKVARSLGGTLITAESKDPLRRRLYNVVEEMAIASGIPMPEVYVLEQESAINAFAAGFTTGDAAVTVTRGTLETLTRDELQGVIGHEFSHILNGDMRLNTRLMGFLFGILVIGLIGRAVLNSARYGNIRSDNSRRDGAAAIYLAGLGLFLIGYIGVFFGQLIKAAVSRQREFLADASAVQFTRQTQGIAGALKKIAAAQQGSELQRVDAEEVSHMLFATGASFSSLLATHPPLVQRIKALEPNFEESEIDRLAGQMLGQTQNGSEAIEGSSSTAGFAPQHFVVTPATVTETVGMPDEGHIQLASTLRQLIPENLYRAAHSGTDALPLVLALLLDANEAVRRIQLDLIAEQLGGTTVMAAETLQLEIQKSGPEFRLPLLQIAFPLIKNRPLEQLERIADLVQRLIEVDGVVDTFEFALSRVLKTHLNDAAHPQRRHGNLRLTQLPEAVGALFSVMAKQGHAEADAAYQKGMECLGRHEQRIKMLIDTKQWPDYEPPQDWVSATDAALNQLDGLQVLDKQALVSALVLTLSHDGKVSPHEAELLRAICATLHCPLPPFVFDANGI